MAESGEAIYRGPKGTDVKEVCYGLWKIKAKYKEDFTTTGTAYFELKKDEPVERPAHISLEPEKPFISHKNIEDFKITIKASSIDGQNVREAEVFALFRIIEDLNDTRKDMMFAGIEKTKLVNGVAEINFNTSKAVNLLNKTIEVVNYKYLNIFVDIQEIVAGDYTIDKNKGINVKYFLFPYTLDLVATPLFLKPGLPFSIKVLVKDATGNVVTGMAITLSAKTVDQTQEKTDLGLRKSTTNSDGIASFAIDIPSDVTTLEFQVRTDDPELPEEYQTSNHYQAVAYSSHSQSFLSLSWPDSYKSLLVGEQLSVTVTPKSPHADRITHYNYLISSRGKIVNFGTQKKLPGSSFQILNLTLTQHMVPTACLLVYYFVIEDQMTELVSDSVCLKVEENCDSQFQICVSSNRNTPSLGKGISLTMETQSEAWVVLSAVNISTYLPEGRCKNPTKGVKYMLTYLV
ncbi:complement C5-like [Suncus etruscus]|uniref:complement C5-like n=1 Tax=Suncus etruscus TaxID=109475 RepID=UPI00210F3492|nr:complement C5-like [Suncus etruscus]